MSGTRTIPVHGANLKENWKTEFSGFAVGVVKKAGDGASVRRLSIESDGARLVLLPSKGLSPLSCSFGGEELFWEPPLENIPDPEEIDLSGTLLINGKPEAGARWIATFLGGVELMGLDNWGLFGRGEKGELLSLHGNASSIPVHHVETGRNTDGDIVCEGGFLIHDSYRAVRPDMETPARWKVERRITLSPARRSLAIRDTITNLADAPLFPDWGYHIQLRPEPGCRLLIPSAGVKPRFGGSPEAGFEEWQPAADESVREERGYIHRRLLSRGGRVKSLLRYSDGRGLGVSVPHSPYTLAWNSCGGAMSREFLLPERPQEPFITGSWNGVGPEVGASALDHDGDTDPEVREKVLGPGASRSLDLSFSLLSPEKADELEEEISAYTRRRSL